MNILAVDTSSKFLTIALSSEDKIIAEYSIDSRTTHSEKLMPGIESLLKEANISVDDIDLFVVSKGPGSYTGLRIGVASIKAMAYANDKKIIGISSLENIANNIEYFDGYIIPMIDARNNRVFAGIYKDLKKIREDRAYDLKEFLEDIKKLKGNKLFIGDGARAYEKEIKGELEDDINFASIKSNYPRATSLCELAIKRAQKSEYDGYYDLVPEYLRPSQAERQKLKD